MRRRNVMTMMTMALLLPAPAMGQLTDKWGIPGSPTGQAVALVLEMVERGDAEYIRNAVEERFTPEFRTAVPMDVHVATFMDLHQRLPDLEPAGLMRSPEGADLRVRGSNGVELRMSIQATEEGAVAGLRIEEAQGGGSLESAARPLPDRLREWSEEDRFSGVVLRTREGREVWSGAYGPADRAHDIPNTVDTRFNIASLTKAFTGAAILLLWEEGRLSLDDPIGRWLDGFPAEVAGKVTVRHLLTHTSGWGHYWEHPTFRAELASLRSVGDYMAFIRDIPLDFEPGTAEQYSNVGYEVLGAVVEAASGQDYYDFVEDRIFRPLGMEESGFPARDRPEAGRAVGYTVAHPHAVEGEILANTLLLGPRGTPAGGSYSTAADLARFWFAMLDYRLLGEAASHMVMGDFVEGEGPPGGVNIYGGGGPGIRAAVVLDPDGRSIDVVLANLDTPEASRLPDLLEAGS